jgi:hypothetical protein
MLLIGAFLVLNVFAEGSKMTCTLTGKEVKTCCCEELKNGKMFCKLAKKEVAKCCCTGM